MIKLRGNSVCDSSGHHDSASGCYYYEQGMLLLLDEWKECSLLSPGGWYRPTEAES